MIEQKDFLNFAKQKGLRRRIESLIASLIGKKTHVEFSYIGDSFYDPVRNLIKIGFEYALQICNSWDEILLAMYVFVCHEVEHALSTDIEFYNNFYISNGKRLSIKYGLNVKYCTQIISNLINMIEDGRIERISGDRLAGMKPKYKLYRELMFRDVKISDNELSNCINYIFVMATYGEELPCFQEMPKETLEYYHTFDSVINTFVNGNHVNDYASAANTIVEMLEPYFEKLPKQDESKQSEGENIDDKQSTSKEEERKTNEMLDQILSRIDKDIVSTGFKDSFKESGHLLKGLLVKNDFEESSEVSQEKGDNCIDTDKTKRELIEEVIQIEHEERREVELQLEISKRREASRLDKSEISSLFQGKQVIDAKVAKLLDDYAPRLSLTDDVKKYKRQFKELIKSKETNTLYRQRTGKIDKHHLVGFLSTNKTDIFYKEGLKRQLDCAIVINIDQSGSTGSMVNGKNTILEHEMIASAMMEEIFQDIIPLKIIGFSVRDYSLESNHIIYKDFGVNNTLNVLNYQYSSIGGNNDTAALMMGCEELLKRSETNKIIFMLTDGSPSVGVNEKEYNSHDYERNVINELKEKTIQYRKKGITIVSIAFGNQSKETYHNIYGKENCIYCQPENIAKNLLLYLKRNFKKF